MNQLDVARKSQGMRFVRGIALWSKKPHFEDVHAHVSNINNNTHKCGECVAAKRLTTGDRACEILAPSIATDNVRACPAPGEIVPKESKTSRSQQAA